MIVVVATWLNAPRVAAICAMGAAVVDRQIDREAVKRDRSEPPADALPARNGTEVAELARRLASAPPFAPAIEPVGARAPVEYVTVDDEEIGLTRRQFSTRDLTGWESSPPVRGGHARALMAAA